MMLKNLPQFVPSSVCLACDGCCRFKDEHSAWRPKVSSEEILENVSQEKGLAEIIFSKESVASDGHLKTRNAHGPCHCTFFNLEKNTCGIYSQRPFECQLYPFLLIKKDAGMVIGVHLNCPYVQEKRHTEIFDNYVSVLKQYFKESQGADFIRRNLSLAGDYSAYQEEIEDIFTL